MYRLKVTECNDSDGNPISGAVIVVLPEEPFFDLSGGGVGQDWPSLPYARCNKTDSNGQCEIDVPEGYRAWVIMIPPDPTIKGASFSHVFTGGSGA